MHKYSISSVAHKERHRLVHIRSLRALRVCHKEIQLLAYLVQCCGRLSAADDLLVRMQGKYRIDAPAVVGRASDELEWEHPHLGRIIVRQCSGVGHQIAVRIIKYDSERILRKSDGTIFTGPSVFSLSLVVCPVIAGGRLAFSQHHRRLFLDYHRRGIYPQTHCARCYEIYLERKIRVIVILRFREVQHLERLYSRHGRIECLTGKKAVPFPVYMSGCLRRIYVVHRICKEIGMRVIPEIQADVIRLTLKIRWLCGYRYCRQHKSRNKEH